MNRFVIFTIFFWCFPYLCSARNISSLEYWLMWLVGGTSAFLFLSVAIILILNKRERIKEKAMASQSSTSPSGTDKRNSNKIRELQKKIDEKSSEISSLKETIKELENENEQIRSSLEYFRKKVLNAKADITPQMNSETSSQQEVVKDEHNYYNRRTINLTVLEGPLVEAGPEHAVYYKAWREGNILLFEFVNNDRTKKAINNRTSIIEPFCEKVETSKSPDDSERIITREPGVLNEDYSIRNKVKIEYV